MAEVFVSADTGRGVAPGSRYSRRHPGAPTTPLIHASPIPVVKATRTGSSMVAACGTRIATVYDGRSFERDPGRRCRKCVEMVRVIRSHEAANGRTYEPEGEAS